MFFLALSLILGGGSAGVIPPVVGGLADTVPPVNAAAANAPFDTAFSRLLAPADSPHVRPRVIEVSDWYSRRLTIHRYVFYATIPVFAAQYAAGKQLYDKSRAAPTWAKTTHRVGATALAGMFTVNTVTGAWNWWDSRAVRQGRVMRTMHALTMLAADAAFTYTGAKLSNDAENSAVKRREHRTVALYAIGVTMLSGTAMKIWNR
jgi:hypothetical protein